MTFKRQLLILMLIVFSLLIVSVFMIQFQTTRNYLKQQQTTELNNAVTAVGMTLAPYLAKDDMVSANTVLRAMFDNSVYHSVSLQRLDNGKTLTQSYSTVVQGVPSWFVDMINIAPIKSSSIITSGWLQLARLTVISSPIQAYQQLWQASTQILIYFIGIFIFLFLTLYLLLKAIFKPLELIRDQAILITKNQFSEPMPLPQTSDLAYLVTAFNQMTEQLKSHFQQQAKDAEKLRVRAYQDPVSGLANRDYLLTQLDAWLEAKMDGGVMLLKAHSIEALYKKNNYQQAETDVKRLASRLLAIAPSDSVLGRLSQSEFMLIVDHADANELMGLGKLMLNIADDLQPNPLMSEKYQAVVGIVAENQNQSRTQILAQLDNAAVDAESNLNLPLSISESVNIENTFGKQQWKGLVLEAIANKQFKFKTQHAVDSNGHTLYEELFAYIQQGSNIYNARQFLHSVESMDIGAQLDMYLIDLAFERVRLNPTTYPVALNITQSSINNIGFIRWLASKLSANQDLQHSIVFELPESSFIKSLDNVSALCDVIHQQNYRFGIDRFGHQFSAMGYLSEFHPDYVKLDFAYTSSIIDENKCDALTSIIQATKNLNIVSIATRIETVEQQQKLAVLNINGFQGYVVDKLKSSEKV